MHAGWPLLDRTIALLYACDGGGAQRGSAPAAYPQVYLDIAVVNWTQPRAEFHRYLRSLVEAGYGKRIMFGSDQMVWPEAIEMAVAAVQSGVRDRRTQGRSRSSTATCAAWWRPPTASASCAAPTGSSGLSDRARRGRPSADYLTAAQKGDIFFHNAARFLRLEPTPPVAPKGAMETLIVGCAAGAIGSVDAIVARIDVLVATHQIKNAATGLVLKLPLLTARALLGRHDDAAVAALRWRSRSWTSSCGSA